MTRDLLADSPGPCALVAARHGRMLCLRQDVFIGRSLTTYGEWCELELALLGPICRAGDVVVDAGANVGTHALAFAHRVGPGGTVLAFEPQATIAHLLGANALMNGLTQLRPQLIALGERDGAISVPRLDPAAEFNHGGLGLAEATRGDQVAVRRLDALVDPPNLRLLKIDVEGMEGSVVRGASGLIERFRPLLYVENDRADSSDALIEAIEALDYRLFWHVVPLFNEDNFAGERHNLFPGIASFNMVGIHCANGGEVTGLPPVRRGKHPLAGGVGRADSLSTRLPPVPRASG